MLPLRQNVKGLEVKELLDFLVNGFLPQGIVILFIYYSYSVWYIARNLNAELILHIRLANLISLIKYWKNMILIYCILSC